MVQRFKSCSEVLGAFSTRPLWIVVLNIPQRLAGQQVLRLKAQVQHACLPQAMLGTDVLCQALWSVSAPLRGREVASRKTTRRILHLYSNFFSTYSL